MPQKKKPVLLYVWFDAHEELPDDKKSWADHVNYIQHRIYVGHALWQSHDGRHTNLKHDYLTEIIPKDVMSKLKPWLIGTKEHPKAEFLASDHLWWEGTERKPGKCLGYRVADRFAKRKPIRVPTRDDDLADRVRENRRRDYKSLTKVMRRIMANIQKVEIDMEGALDLLPLYPFEGGDGYSPDEARKATGETLTIIRDKAYVMPNRCPYWRCHHVLTRLARGFRRFLTVNGRAMVNIDIANSQPLFLFLAIVPFICSGGITAGDVSFLSSADAHLGASPTSDDAMMPIGAMQPSDAVPIHSDSPTPAVSHRSLAFSPVTPPLSSHSHSYTTPKNGRKRTEALPNKAFITASFVSEGTLANLVGKFPDLGRYRDMVQGGKLYQYLMNEINWMGSKQRFKDECVFKLYYGPNNDRDKRGNYEPCRLKPIFERDFPTIWHAIRGIKTAKGWKELSHEMQRREARVMIDGVCVRIMEQVPEAVFFPIHDSIMVEPRYEGAVKTIIMNEMGKVGLIPTLGVTDYNENNTQESVVLAA